MYEPFDKISNSNQVQGSINKKQTNVVSMVTLGEIIAQPKLGIIDGQNYLFRFLSYEFIFNFNFIRVIDTCYIYVHKHKK